jgi:predicted DNA-binding transcriptional regulator AlpA
MYRFKELKLHGVPWTRKHVTTLEKRGLFPKHVNLGDNTVAWIGEEVDQYVEQKVRAARGIARGASLADEAA